METIVSIWLVSYVIVIIATLFLSVYFFREYASKKLRALLSWGMGFLLFAVAMGFDLFLLAWGIVPVYWEIMDGLLEGLAIGSMVTVFAMISFYYGTSLQFFSHGSFFREKLSVLLILIYFVYFAYASLSYPIEVFWGVAGSQKYLILVTPIFFIIAILFYRISQRIDPSHPSRRASLFISTAWFLLVIRYAYKGLFWGRYDAFDAMLYILEVISWILILYGMIIGKVVALIGKEKVREEERPVLICPRCKNRIQENWSTCPYCGERLK